MLIHNLTQSLNFRNIIQLLISPVIKVDFVLTRYEIHSITPSSIMRSVHLSRGFSHHWSWGTGAPLGFRYCHKCHGHRVGAGVVAPCSKFRVDLLECPRQRSSSPLAKITPLTHNTHSSRRYSSFPLMLPCDHWLAGKACRWGRGLGVPHANAQTKRKVIMQRHLNQL